MHVTTRGRYAIRAMLRLARVDNGKPIAVQQIASAEEISPAYLEQLLILLCAARVVKSTRGAGGGFVLGRTPAEVTVKNVLDAVGEEIILTPCTTDGQDSDCVRTAGCTAARMWTDASEHIKQYFAGLTLERLLEDIAAAEAKAAR